MGGQGSGRAGSDRLAPAACFGYGITVSVFMCRWSGQRRPEPEPVLAWVPCAIKVTVRRVLHGVHFVPLVGFCSWCHAVPAVHRWCSLCCGRGCGCIRDSSPAAPPPPAASAQKGDAATPLNLEGMREPMGRLGREAVKQVGALHARGLPWCHDANFHAQRGCAGHWGPPR